MKAFKFFVYLTLALICVGVCVHLWQLANSVTWQEFITPVKRTFYSIIIPYIFLLVARVLRAIAKYYEAKTRRISDE